LDGGNGRDVNPFDFAAAASEGLVIATKPTTTATLAARVLVMLLLLTASA
jgi:hypothetical protein